MTTELTPHRVDELPPGAEIVYRGAAARRVAEDMGKVGRHLVRAVERGETYRLVAPEHLQRQMRDGTLGFARPRSGGDASVLIKDKADGTIRGHGQLVRDRRPTASVVGPLAWQALAVATQQHFLVEIDEKLSRLDAKLGDLLRRDVERSSGKVEHARELADAVRSQLLSDARVSAARRSELEARNAELDELISVLCAHASGEIEQYRDGSGTAEKVSAAFVEVVAAEQALCDTASVLVMCAVWSGAGDDEVVAEEDDRLARAHTRVERVRQAMCEASEHWTEEHFAYVEWRELGLLERIKRDINDRKLGRKTPSKVIRKDVLQLADGLATERGLLMAMEGGELVMYRG